jgi:tRNA-dihydrouridine synthase A
MMDWTDRHCRYFHRLMSSRTLLYTEMVTTGALIHGDIPRHLTYHESEHPLALQLGGSEPEDLAHCAKLAEDWGYDEINLNCGCPSERVQRGAFGACLMLEPQRVADCVKAMKDRVSLAVTVKHRIGVDSFESYGFVRDFVGEVSLAGCDAFIVHARSAWLQGLSPKENREIPPLRYEVVSQLKADFPHLQFILNGGVTDNSSIQRFLTPDQSPALDGVMVGRAAYHTPYMMSEWDALIQNKIRQTQPQPQLLLLPEDPPNESLNEPLNAPLNAPLNIHPPTHSPKRDLPDKGAVGAVPKSREEIECAYVEYMHQMLEQSAATRTSSHQPSDFVSCTYMARHMLGLWHGQAGARRWRQVWSDPSLNHESVLTRQRLATQARLNAQTQEP